MSCCPHIEDTTVETEAGLLVLQGGSRNRYTGTFAGSTDIKGQDFYIAACAPHVTEEFSRQLLRGSFDYLRVSADVGCRQAPLALTRPCCALVAEHTQQSHARADLAVLSGERRCSLAVMCSSGQGTEVLSMAMAGLR